MAETQYTPGHTPNATEFMAKRSLDSHGGFFVPYLEAGLDVLDVGCGPGTITADLAALVSPGQVTGLDFGESQVERARAHCEARGLDNVRFEAGDCSALPFPDATFDRVFSHALMEHLADPVGAIREMHRVLKPGGRVGLCSPDFDGLLLAPPSKELERAVSVYADLQRSNGGNLRVGKHLGEYLREAGFGAIQVSARYECYPSLVFIGEYLALQLDKVGQSKHAGVLRQWSQAEEGLFAQAWVSAVGRKP